MQASMQASGTVLVSDRAVNPALGARRETAGRAVKRRDLHGFNVIESAYPSGLVLSRQIAEGHGGALTLENRSDRSGCAACLRLPA